MFFLEANPVVSVVFPCMCLREKKENPRVLTYRSESETGGLAKATCRQQTKFQSAQTVFKMIRTSCQKFKKAGGFHVKNKSEFWLFLKDVEALAVLGLTSHMANGVGWWMPVYHKSRVAVVPSLSGN